MNFRPKKSKMNLGLMAVGYYAILETAYRKKNGLSLEEHRDKISHMYAEFSEIAANNPDGWIDSNKSAEDIKQVSKENPLQALPYNKFHCTSWNVNQASAMILCSEDLADKLGIPKNKRVYPLASSETNHMIAPIQRPKLSESTGLDLAAKFIKDICESIKYNQIFMICIAAFLSQFKCLLTLSILAQKMLKPLQVECLLLAVHSIII